MPCYDERSSAEWQYKNEWRPEMDRLTRIACDLATALTTGGTIENCSRETQRWWEEHQQADRRRQAREVKEKSILTKKRVALSKLTAEERRLLGVRR